MEDSWEELTGEGRTAKDLFKLIVRKGQIRVQDAPKLLGVAKNTTDEWTKTLIEKKYAVSDGEGDDATLRPSDQILSKISVYRERLLTEGIRDGDILASELEKEKATRKVLEDHIRDKEHIISGLNDDLIKEKKEKFALEETVALLKKGDFAATRFAELEGQLQRERTERKKLEELLKKREEELESMRAERPQATMTTPAPKTHIIQTIQEPLTPSNTPATNEAFKAGDNILDKPEIPIKQESPKPAVSWYKSDASKAQEPGRETEPNKAPTDAVDERDATGLLMLLHEKGKVGMKDIGRELKADDKTTKAWLNELGEYDAVEAVRRLFGGVEVSLKKGVEVDSIKEKIHARKVRQEMQKLRGAL
jgi:Mn-dependent DtxR family transcriptional regulator